MLFPRHTPPYAAMLVSGLSVFVCFHGVSCLLESELRALLGHLGEPTFCAKPGKHGSSGRPDVVNERFAQLDVSFWSCQQRQCLRMSNIPWQLLSTRVLGAMARPECFGRLALPLHPDLEAVHRAIFAKALHLLGSGGRGQAANKTAAGRLASETGYLSTVAEVPNPESRGCACMAS